VLELLVEVLVVELLVLVVVVVANVSYILFHTGVVPEVAVCIYSLLCPEW
jgi:hypothetical protein